MSKKDYIVLQDLVTGEIHYFATLHRACDHINKVTGLHIGPSTVYSAIKRCGLIAKKRFKSCVDPDADIVTPNRSYSEGGWEFSQYGISDCVIVAEKKIKWYNEDRMEEINEKLHELRCRVFWDLNSDGYKRQNTRIEIYKKFRNKESFKEKVVVMKEIIKEIGL